MIARERAARRPVLPLPDPAAESGSSSRACSTPRTFRTGWTSGAGPSTIGRSGGTCFLATLPNS